MEEEQERRNKNRNGERRKNRRCQCVSCAVVLTQCVLWSHSVFLALAADCVPRHGFPVKSINKQLQDPIDALMNVLYIQILAKDQIEDTREHANSNNSRRHGGSHF